MNSDEKQPAAPANPYQAPQAPLTNPPPRTVRPGPVIADNVLSPEMLQVARGCDSLLMSTWFVLLAGVVMGGFAGWFQIVPLDQRDISGHLTALALAITIPPFLILLANGWQVLGIWRCANTPLPQGASAANIALICSIMVLLSHGLALGMNVVALQKMDRSGGSPRSLELVSMGSELIVFVSMLVYWKRMTAYLDEEGPIKCCRIMTVAGSILLVIAAVSGLVVWKFEDALPFSIHSTGARIGFWGTVVVLWLLLIVSYMMCLVQTRRAIRERMPTIEDCRQQHQRDPLP